MKISKRVIKIFGVKSINKAYGLYIKERPNRIKSFEMYLKYHLFWDSKYWCLKTNKAIKKKT